MCVTLPDKPKIYKIGVASSRIEFNMIIIYLMCISLGSNIEIPSFKKYKYFKIRVCKSFKYCSKLKLFIVEEISCFNKIGMINRLHLNKSLYLSRYEYFSIFK